MPKLYIVKMNHHSGTIQSLLKNCFNVNIVNSPALHSTLTGQVEIYHSTLSEIARCLKLGKHLNDTTELIFQTTIVYNGAIHSVVNMKPIDI